MTTDSTAAKAAAGTGLVLLTLSAAQFLMTLDSSVMNVSIATVAKDVGTDVAGIQSAITFYTLVMAAFMITGGNLGKKMGRKRAFALGCVIYGAGSLTTALAGSLPVLMFGWSILEGLGAALILPTVVALVAVNFAAPERPRAYGLVASAGAIAVALGPLIGGAFTTYLSWRGVFAGEVMVVVVILLLNRRTQDVPPEATGPMDLIGTLLSAVGMALVVFGVLRAGPWGIVSPKAGAPEWFGLSPVIFLIRGGGLVLWAFLEWERHVIALGKEPLVNPAILRVTQLRAGLNAFFFQFFLQSGLFFTIPLFLSVALGLSAIDTGIRILPLSITLLAAAVGVPRVWPNASPRRIVRIGFVLLFIAIVVLLVLLDSGAGAEIVTWPMLLAGLGIGALSSQLGAVTVGAVDDSRSGEVGGLQNTITNLGASMGTAAAGAVLLAALTSAFLSGVATNPKVSDAVKSQASVELSAGVPFVSDAQLEAGLEQAGVPTDEAQQIVDVNAESRIAALRTAMAFLAVVAFAAILATRRIPKGRPEGVPPMDLSEADAPD